MVWVLFLNAHTCLFVCLFVVCLLVHTFAWIHVNVHVRMHNNQRDIGELFYQHGFFFLWLTKLGSFCSFSILTLLHISKHCTSMQAIIITSRVSFYRVFNDLSDDIKHASIITEIREQLLIKLRFPNFFWAVYIIISVIESFLACGWTIAYHVIKWWTSYPRKPWIVDFGSRFFTGCDDVIRE